MLRRQSVEHRLHTRKRMLKGGIIAFAARHATLPCVVRDISDAGARLQVGAVSSVPDTFELIVELDGLEVPAEVVWRSIGEIGVRFLAPPKMVPPKRAQSVAVAIPAASRTKPTLRRQDIRPVAGSPSRAEKIVAPSAPAAHPETPSPLPSIAAQRQGQSEPPLPSPVGYAAAPMSPSAPAATAPASNPASIMTACEIPIVIADDDPDDRMLLEDAFRETDFKHPITFVENGEELLKFLYGAAPYQRRKLPGLVLLDLNMPLMDGRTALMHLKMDAKLRRIPVIVLTTSNADDDIQRTYDLGVSAYIPKPSTFDGLIELVEALNNYWLRMVSLPAPDKS